MNRNIIMDRDTTRRKLERMAYEILEDNPEASEIILAGILDKGAVVARAIQQLLAGISSLSTRLITIRMNKRNPGEIVLSEKMDFTGKVIIIIDDVTNSGRTLLYAIKPFLDYHPGKIQTLVLVERTHKAFPVHIDYTGLSVATTLQEHIIVEVEKDVLTGAYLE